MTLVVPQTADKISRALQAAEKLGQDSFCNQGPTLVGPQNADNKGWALAPAECFRLFYPK
jgi:hypothetical protein